MQKRTAVYSVIFFVLLLFFLSFLKKDNSLTSWLYGHNVSFQGIDSFIITKEAEHKVTAKYGESVIKVTTTNLKDKESAQEFVSERNALLMGLYEPQLPPYPEFLTRATGCKSKFLPERYEYPHGDEYRVYAGERFGYGVCDDSLVEYRAVLGYFYCPAQETLFTIEYFTPHQDSLQSERSIGQSFVCGT